MNKHYYWILLIPAILIIILLFNKESIKNSPNYSQILETCKTLSYSGENKPSILFLTDKNTAESYKDYLTQYDPFKDYKNDINFFYIDDYTPKCELYDNKALFCYSKELIKKSSSCKSDYIVTIQPEKVEIRSSSYMNVVSINKNHPKSVILHELGHAIANLAEEYVPAQLIDNSKNCVQSCSYFSNNSNDCFQGCSNSDLYRSINSGVMRTLNSNEYGEFDENLIKEKLNIENSIITGNAVNKEESCANQKYYLITATYKDGKISIIDKTIEPGCPGSNGDGQFSYKIISNNNEIIEQNQFGPQYLFTDSPSSDQIDGEIYSYEEPFYLKVPISTNDNSLIIEKENIVLAQINLNDVGARPCKI